MHKSLSPISRRALAGLSFIEPPEPNPTDPPGAPAPTDPPKEEKTFTQADLNRIASKEKAEGKKAAAAELAESLGVTVEEAKQIISKHREADEASKTEAQKDREAAAEEKKKAEAEKAEAAQEVFQTRLERAFAKEGIDLDDSTAEGKAKSARLRRLVTVEVGSSYDDVLSDVKQIKTDFPGLFGDGTPGTPGRPAPNGDPKGTPPPPKPGEEKFAAGQKRAEARYVGSGGPIPLLGKKQ